MRSLLVKSFGVNQKKIEQKTIFWCKF